MKKPSLLSDKDNINKKKCEIPSFFFFMFPCTRLNGNISDKRFDRESLQGMNASLTAFVNHFESRFQYFIMYHHTHVHKLGFDFSSINSSDHNDDD